MKINQSDDISMKFSLFVSFLLYAYYIYVPIMAIPIGVTLYRDYIYPPLHIYFQPIVVTITFLCFATYSPSNFSILFKLIRKPSLYPLSFFSAVTSDLLPTLAFALALRTFLVPSAVCLIPVNNLESAF